MIGKYKFEGKEETLGYANALFALQKADDVLDALLFSSLAGLTLMALTFLLSLEETLRRGHGGGVERDKETLSSIANIHKATTRFSVAFLAFVTSLFLTLVFDTYGALFSKILLFESVDVTLTGVAFVVGLFYLLTGSLAIRQMLQTGGIQLEEVETEE